MVQVTKLFVYPVKSCRGIALERAAVGPTGLRWDRNWVVTDDQGKFITQRSNSKLALVEVELTPLELLTSGAAPSLAGGALVLRAPGMPSELRIPLDSEGAEKCKVPVQVWEWSGEGRDEGPAAAEWLTQYLGWPARLVRYAGAAGQGPPPADEPTRRPVDGTFVPAGAYEIAFSDQFPYLLASEASLDALNQSLPAPIPMDRFRPNILIAGSAGAPLAPWEEDSWAALALGTGAGEGAGAPRFDCVKPCSRCQVPTIDQATGVRSPDNEPTETMHKLRSGAVLGWLNPKPFKHSVFFAWNLVTKDTGTVAVGDAVTVLSLRSGPPGPLKQ